MEGYSLFDIIDGLVWLSMHCAGVLFSAFLDWADIVIDVILLLLYID
jgi:hypothetical protein